ncbi:Uncharacterised protein [Catenibacterium mitsuokai]|nr:Uncharacterised protein [Catenibacterium mitsuokai]
MNGCLRDFELALLRFISTFTKNYSSDICCIIVRQLSDDNATDVGRISNNRRTNNSLQGKT